MNNPIKTRFIEVQAPKQVVVTNNIVDTIIHLNDNYSHLSMFVHMISGNFTSGNIYIAVNPTYDDEQMWTALSDPAIGAGIGGLPITGLVYVSFNTQAVFRRIRFQATLTGGTATATIKYCPMIRLADGV